MIKPTVGRVVWYWPTAKEICDLELSTSKEQPLAATIAYVHSDRMVNLSVVDHTGKQFGRTGVLLLTVSGEGKAAPGYAQWMPYQKSQAAKTDALTELLSSITEAKQADPQDQDAELMLIAELDAGTAAAEALIDHLQAMGSPGRATIPVKRGDSEYEIIVSRK